jgi:glycine dehydrogenase subunit 2
VSESGSTGREPADDRAADADAGPDDASPTADHATYDQARWAIDGTLEPLLAEKDLTTIAVDDADVALPDDLTRDELTLPGLAEPELAEHYTRLSEMNYGVNSGPYPLGSCSMKYNPPYTEAAAADPNALVHPDRPDATLQGTLALCHELAGALGAIAGMDAVSLQPPAGAAGELAGVLIAGAYHRDRDDGDRTEVVIPDSAHGTNFASAAVGGFDVVEVPSGDDGRVDLGALEDAIGDETALFMLTNPNTLGVFEEEVRAIADAVHDAGGLMYYDGANLNALLGRVRPGDMGFDVMHFNLHKTFATPHGGGGPGAGPIGVRDDLASYLPSPVVQEAEDGYERIEPDDSIGKIHGFHGNWLVLVKAFAYIQRLGDAGLQDVSAKAVLNANYLASQLDAEVPFGPFFHEFVASAGDRDAAAVAKAMLDHGVHPPTTKWPELVPEALMTEPTETESKRGLDHLAAAFEAALADPAEDAPQRTAVGRIDQTSAARDPRLTWADLDGVDTADTARDGTDS